MSKGINWTQRDREKLMRHRGVEDATGPECKRFLEQEADAILASDKRIQHTKHQQKKRTRRAWKK